MRRGLKLLPPALLFAAVLEIVVFVLVGRAVGFGWAVLAVLTASAAGLLVLRREGMRAWRRFRASAQGGQPPGEQVTDGLVGLAAGLLLAVPGLLSAALGVLLVSPPLRPLARRWVRVVAERRVSAAVAGDLFGPRRVRMHRGQAQPGEPAAGPAGEAIEGEIV